MRIALLEALIVALAGALLAFTANALSPKGLKLTRDYFPALPAAGPVIAGATNQAPVLSSTNQSLPPASGSLAARLQSKGLQLAYSNQVQELFRDPRYEQNQVLFIDARDNDHYQAGHIPGAYQFDYYHPENFAATVVPLCQAAQLIIVYCHGGEKCEDSELTATWLRDTGIPAEKLFIYGGGITEWELSQLPMEIGARKSGNLRAASK